MLDRSYSNKIPEPALRRLPWYLSYVKLLKSQGEAIVSSTQIAKKIDVSASQIAKDLSYVDISGKTRVGYDVDEFIQVLETFLGFTKFHKAVVFGVGSLGAALLSDSGLEQYGLKIIAGVCSHRRMRPIGFSSAQNVGWLRAMISKTETRIPMLCSVRPSLSFSANHRAPLLAKSVHGGAARIP